MAVIYAQGNNGLLGTLGSLATLGGKLIPGAQWLTPIGLGMEGINAAMNGSPLGALRAMGKLAKLKNPLGTDDDDEIAKKWSPFLNGGWGSNPWQP